MRYVFAKDDLTVRSKLEAGSLLLVFPPEEQWLAEGVIRAMMKTLENDSSLLELLELVRCTHNKEEEN
jgi:hypothetical protein